MRTVLVILSLMFASATYALDTNDAIALSVFDYIDGWYEADGLKMEQALHPELADRELYQSAVGPKLEQIGALSLIRKTIAGGGAGTKADDRIKEVIILDVDGDTASVKTLFHDRTAYLHMAKIAENWVIVNVLWRSAYTK